MHMGLTKREHFAGLAMQSLIPVYAEMIEEYSTPQEWLKCHMETACDMADALLTELEKPKQLTELEKELLEALELAMKQIKELDDVLNNENHAVVGWHLNGDHEPVSTFFEDSDFNAIEIGEKAIAKAKGQL